MTIVYRLKIFSKGRSAYWGGQVGLIVPAARLEMIPQEL